MNFLIGNFELAYCLEKSINVTSAFEMSDASFAPEIRAGKPHDQSVDIWALGQIIYRLLCAIDD